MTKVRRDERQARIPRQALGDGLPSRSARPSLAATGILDSYFRTLLPDIMAPTAGIAPRFFLSPLAHCNGLCPGLKSPHG